MTRILVDVEAGWAMCNLRMPAFTGRTAINAQRKLVEAHGFTLARKLFIKGRITTAQAIGMVAADRDWIAETEVNGDNPLEVAREVVMRKWVRMQIEEMTK